MTDCGYQEWLSPYHDGELAPARRRELEPHVAACNRCAEELRRLRALSRVLADAERPAAPAGMMERLHAAVDAVAPGSIIALCRSVSLAAALLLVLCAALLLSGRLPALEPDAQPAAWEVAAVALDPDLAPGGAEELTTLWVTSDLSRENGW